MVVKDIIRKYPGKYEGILSDLLSEIVSVDLPEARASLVWILGDYVNQIENSKYMIRENFINNFAEETEQVQEQALTAVIKVALSDENFGTEILNSLVEQFTY